MQKIIDFFRKLFAVNVEQRIDANRIKETTINQTANIYNFLFPGIILSVVLFSLVLLGYKEYLKSQYNLSPMASGNLNVVVAPFTDQTKGQCGTGKNIGILMASAFHTLLISGEYDQTSKIKPVFRSPYEIPKLEGNNDDELTNSAEELARQINAQIVIYGSITCTEIIQKPSVKVMFFVAPTGFGDAQELIGEFSFSSGALYGNLDSGQDFLGSNENLQHKINVMSLIVNSLGYYLGENYSKSLRTISIALKSPLWESEHGKEVVYILAGNIEQRYAQQLNDVGNEKQALEEIERARNFYTLANNISLSEGKGEHARAYIGLAGVEHFYATYKSRNSCQLQDIDITKLVIEKDKLDHAEKAENKSSTADIHEKIAFTKAQIDFTLYTLNPGVVNLVDVEKNYSFVIASYINDGNPNFRIQEIAAHSYSGLAFINWINGNDQKVVLNFNLAITTTETPSLQTGYLKSLGDFYSYKQDYEKALIYYREALGITEQFKIIPTNCEVDLKNIIISTEKKLLP